MSETTWASGLLQENVAPVGSAQYVETRIRNAAKALGWTFSRARTIWYADERASIKPREVRDLEEYTGIKYGRQELHEIDRLIGRADALLMGQDPDFYRAFSTGLRAFFGALDRTRTPGGDQ